MDTDYHQPRFAELRARIAASGHAERVADIVVAPLVTGFAAGKGDQVSEDVASVPQLRPTNISADGEINFDDAKAIPKQAVSASDLLQSGEVLFNNTNSAAWVG